MVGWTLGAIYSVPPFRTKKNPILAGLTIATVRGFLLNFGVYFAVKDALGATFKWSPKVSFIARFMTTFATVIAITKDLPDTEGDKVSCLLIFSAGLSIYYRVFVLNRIYVTFSSFLNTWKRPTILKHLQQDLVLIRSQKEQLYVYY